MRGYQEKRLREFLDLMLAAQGVQHAPASIAFSAR
jgi:hypothetical protein